MLFNLSVFITNIHSRFENSIVFSNNQCFSKSLLNRLVILDLMTSNVFRFHVSWAMKQLESTNTYIPTSILWGCSHSCYCSTFDLVTEGMLQMRALANWPRLPEKQDRLLLRLQAVHYSRVLYLGNCFAFTLNTVKGIWTHFCFVFEYLMTFP